MDLSSVVEFENPVINKERDTTTMALKGGFERVLFVIMGASGDLSLRKIYPSIFGLCSRKIIEKKMHVIGYARSAMSQEAFVKKVGESILRQNKSKDVHLQKFLEGCRYFSGEYTDVCKSDLLPELRSVYKNSGKVLAVFYFALPPFVFETVANTIKRLITSSDVPIEENGYRVVIEKPFGKDLESSNRLNGHLTNMFKEEHIYRMDHYLGKEMVRNIITLRFANTIFSHIWNGENISQIQILCEESMSLNGREGYFTTYGIIRDVMQNHLLQVLSYIAMESPLSLDSLSIEKAKIDLLKCIEPIKITDTVVGQYVPSKNNGQYNKEEELLSGTQVPTFATSILRVNNSRWKDVNFVLRCGKGLNTTKTEIKILFKNTDNGLFDKERIKANELVINIGPQHGIGMKINTKKPGFSKDTIQNELSLNYNNKDTTYIPDAYECLLADIIEGDKSDFVCHSELVESWRIFTPLLQELENNRTSPIKYRFGSSGPEEAEHLIQRP